VPVWRSNARPTVRHLREHVAEVEGTGAGGLLILSPGTVRADPGPAGRTVPQWADRLQAEALDDGAAVAVGLNYELAYESF
jgi:hypothetical protein